MEIKATKHTVEVDFDGFIIEVNSSGILYIHDKVHGHTILRVCGLPLLRHKNTTKRDLIDLNFSDIGYPPHRRVGDR